MQSRGQLAEGQAASLLLQAPLSYHPCRADRRAPGLTIFLGIAAPRWARHPLRRRT
jgi:hypothetical protein